MVVSCQIYFPLVKYTLYLISSHSWYFIELSPSAVALTFNLWPLNIYQLLKWLCTIIPSSISQIHHSDHFGQFQVKCTVLTNAGTGQKSCSTRSSMRQSWKHWLAVHVPWNKGLAVKTTWGDCITGNLYEFTALGALDSPLSLVGILRIWAISMQEWKGASVTTFFLFGRYTF